MMREPRLVIADIDGTLTVVQNPLPELSVRAMKELHARGVQLGIASGRQVDTQMKSYPARWGLDFPFDVLIGMDDYLTKPIDPEKLRCSLADHIGK